MSAKAWSLSLSTLASSHPCSLDGNSNRLCASRANVPRAFEIPRTGKLLQHKLQSLTGMEGSLRSVEGAAPGAIELEDASAFTAIANDQGYISICGFGSLLSEKSAKYTFPDPRNFRIGVLRGFRRVFAHVAPVFLERGIANLETKEMSSLSVEPWPGESIVVTVFEIPAAEVPAFIEREHEFRFLVVTPEHKDGQPFSQRAVVCSKYNDIEYRHVRCKGSHLVYHQRYGRFNIQQIWQDDILPCRLYLRHCVLASKNLGKEAYDNFLDHTYLGDRKTTIRQYLDSGTGVGVMEEEPPPALKERYGG